MRLLQPNQAAATSYPTFSYLSEISNQGGRGVKDQTNETNAAPSLARSGAMAASVGRMAATPVTPSRSGHLDPALASLGPRARRTGEGL